MVVSHGPESVFDSPKKSAEQCMDFGKAEKHEGRLGEFGTEGCPTNRYHSRSAAAGEIDFTAALAVQRRSPLTRGDTSYSATSPPLKGPTRQHKAKLGLCYSQEMALRFDCHKLLRGRQPVKRGNTRRKAESTACVLAALGAHRALDNRSVPPRYPVRLSHKSLSSPFMYR